ncbi:MAG: T9SS type A sorting domain-containing protein [Candidatus Eiseniibacteriota bacterium]
MARLLGGHSRPRVVVHGPRARRRRNPASHAVSVRIRLAGSAPVTLELFDPAGRRMRAVTVAGTGEQVVRLDGLDAIPAGLYFLRLAQGAAIRTARIAVAH